MSRRPLSPQLPARAAAISALLMLGACHYASSPLVGFGGFIGDTHTFSNNPNILPGSDENVLHSEGRDVAQQPLVPEPGNIWPGPPPPVPSLTDVEHQQNQEMPQENQPSQTPPPGNRPVTRGSSTPPLPLPPSGEPESVAPPARQVPPPNIGPSSPPVITTPSGPLINNGPVGVPGGPSIATSPTQSGQDIVVPNGNGTSTVISPDGSTHTIPSPR